MPCHAGGATDRMGVSPARLNRHHRFTLPCLNRLAGTDPLPLPLHSCWTFQMMP